MKRVISFLLEVVKLIGGIPAVAFAVEEKITEHAVETVEELVTATEVSAPAETVAPTQPVVPEKTVAPTKGRQNRL